MLTLNSLTVRDFGPYRGRQTMTFTRERGVYIVYGPNGRGKTALHNAFRYALYGEIQGRRRVEKAHNFANSETRKHVGYGSFETILDFQHNGAVYRLTRVYDERKQPHENMFLERNGVPLSQDESERALQAIAPHSVSQFFLFDAELLQTYEGLLDEDSEEGAALEHAIERVLGIPIVSNAKDDVMEVGRTAEKQLAEQYTTHDATRRMALALTEAQDLRAKLQEDHDEIGDKIEAARARIDEIEGHLREQRRAERLLGSLDQLRARYADLERREEAAAEALNELSGDLWKAVLAPSASARLVAVDKDLQSAELDLQEAAAATRDLTHLQTESDCPVCRRVMPDVLRRELAANLDAIASSRHRNAASARLDQAREMQKTLQALALEDTSLIVERDRSLRSLRLERQGVHDEIATVEQQLSEIGEDQLRALTHERDECQAQILRGKERLQKCAEHIRDEDLVIERLKRELRKQSVRPDHTLELKDQVSQALVKLFGDAIEAYRSKLRQRVEVRASKIFSQLTSEPEYVGLRITGRYGLDIIGSDGEVVRRSAGYEHLVALSLITALHDSAAVRGPVIMDAPFGRLDTENTARVVAALPRMSRQVVLLTFDGEFDREAALKALGSSLVAEYTLKREGYKHTGIEPRRTM